MPFSREWFEEGVLKSTNTRTILQSELQRYYQKTNSVHVRFMVHIAKNWSDLTYYVQTVTERKFQFVYFWEFSVGLFISLIYFSQIWLTINKHLHYRALIWKKKERSNEKKIPLSLGMLPKKRRNLVNKSFLDSLCSDLSIIFYTTLWHTYFGISFVWLLWFVFFLFAVFSLVVTPLC